MVVGKQVLVKFFQPFRTVIVGSYQGFYTKRVYITDFIYIDCFVYFHTDIRISRNNIGYLKPRQIKGFTRRGASNGMHQKLF